MQNSLGIVKRPTLGGDIDTLCGKCKEEREHVIAALNALGEVERVQCRTCQNNHIYRKKKAKTATTRTSSSRSTTSKRTPAIDLSGPARPYSMQSRFQVGERIDHPKFGLGLVIEERAGKIDVKFGKEVKTLVNGYRATV